MVGLASELNCQANDLACLCANPDFGYGIHDCTVEACSGDNVQDVESYASSVCASASEFIPAGYVPQKKTKKKVMTDWVCAL